MAGDFGADGSTAASGGRSVLGTRTVANRSAAWGCASPPQTPARRAPGWRWSVAQDSQAGWNLSRGGPGAHHSWSVRMWGCDGGGSGPRSDVPRWRLTALGASGGNWIGFGRQGSDSVPSPRRWTWASLVRHGRNDSGQRRAMVAADGITTVSGRLDRMLRHFASRGERARGASGDGERSGPLSADGVESDAEGMTPTGAPRLVGVRAARAQSGWQRSLTLDPAPYPAHPKSNRYPAPARNTRAGRGFGAAVPQRAHASQRAANPRKTPDSLGPGVNHSGPWQGRRPVDGEAACFPAWPGEIR